MNAPRPGRRERNKQDKRERIKVAARALFATKGFAATTTQAIAERADIGTGTLFLYVRSKEEVLVLVLRDEMDRVFDEAFASLPRGLSFLEQLLHVYGAVIAYHEREQELARVFVKEVLFVQGPLWEIVDEFMNGLYARWVPLIEEARARGEIASDVPPLPLVRNCFAIYFLHLKEWLGLRSRRPTAELLTRLRDALALQLRGLGPARPPGPPRARTI